MTVTKIEINKIPAVIYGDASEKVCLFVHGKCGCKEEAERLAEIICSTGYQVLGFDLPEHGERKNSIKKLFPWETVPELTDILSYAKERWQGISLHATSIGAYFSLLSYRDYAFERALLVSPVVDMKKLIENMMSATGVSEERLIKEKEIPTGFGETLSIKYYTYSKEHPVDRWNSKTFILYAGRDNLTDRGTVEGFARRFGAALDVYADGEHWFHTEKQLSVWRDFVVSSFKDCKRL